jgi:7,8-dihydropterin-6-yl-methyl-4-(beta-D-ribofuranosyl)aminobenzene 5'-phosphate synthase
MIITILFDNEAPPQFKSDWGFSCLIETEKNCLLFDTGASGQILLENMKRLNVDPQELQAVMLSHNHWDHTGGLNELLKFNPKLTIFKPGYTNKPEEIYKGLITTGTLGNKYSIQEQALICNSKDGITLITGCSHPGLENFINVAKKFGKIHAVLGGFHNFDKLEALSNIPIILPCHCTSRKQDIQKLYPDAYRQGGVGKKLRLNE